MIKANKCQIKYSFAPLCFAIFQSLISLSLYFFYNKIINIKKIEFYAYFSNVILMSIAFFVCHFSDPGFIPINEKEESTNDQQILVVQDKNLKFDNFIQQHNYEVMKQKEQKKNQEKENFFNESLNSSIVINQSLYNTSRQLQTSTKENQKQYFFPKLQQKLNNSQYLELEMSQRSDFNQSKIDMSSLQDVEKQKQQQIEIKDQNCNYIKNHQRIESYEESILKKLVINNVNNDKQSKINQDYYSTAAITYDSQNQTNILIHDVQKRFCNKCNLEQPLRAKHCKICKRCVALYDHHCPWLGNCIGQCNHISFLLFLFAGQFQSFQIYFYLILSIINKEYQQLLLKMKTNTFYSIFIIIGLLSIFFFSIMILMMLCYHVYIISCNITTWENLSWNKISYLKNIDQDLIISPFSNGCQKNWKQLVCQKDNIIIEWKLN